MRDYYDTLKIPKSASQEDIKKAYRKLALKFHPDRAQESGISLKEAEERFKEIGEAYTILSDPEKRKQYDMFGPDGFNRFGRGKEGFRMDIDPMEIFRQFFGGLGNNDIFGAFSSSGSPFGGARAYRTSQAPLKGSDLKINLNVKISELEESDKVLKKTISLNRKYQDGQVKKEKIRIKIPKDVKEGKILRIPNKGNQGKMGGLSGDLLVSISLIDDIIEIPISIFLAIRGSDSLTIKSPSGETLIGNLPSNTQENTILNFKSNEGVCKKIRIRHRYPKKITNDHIELLKQLDKLNI